MTRSHKGGRQLLTRGVVHAWQHDQFGHMNARWFAHFFDDAAFFMWSIVGWSANEVTDKYGLHTVSASARTDFVRELTAGMLVEVDGCIKRVGTKSMTLEFRLLNVDTKEMHAAYELVEVFFDPETRSSAPIPEKLRSLLQEYAVGEAA